MQIQDKKVVDEHNLAMFKARQKELSAVTEIKRKSRLNQIKEESGLLSLLTKLQRMRGVRSIMSFKRFKPLQKMHCKHLSTQLLT